LKFQIYTGKSNGEKPEMGLGAQVVTDLCEELYGKNHRVFMDNFFTSYNLFVLLKSQQTYAVGTLNPSRKHIPKLKRKVFREEILTAKSVIMVLLCTNGWTNEQ
jgi:hypothetical protein